MCGIVGGISFTDHFFPDQAELDNASAYLKYRGPDDHGKLMITTNLAKVALAHNRLSIIDLTATGHQPMVSSAEKTAIVFNGEIYNYQALKIELQNLGLFFKTQSDTEVVLNGFECWGIERTLQKLDGMFAFALVDKQTNTLFLARDRFGKKPLYYFIGNKKLAFSSDIRSFEKMKDVTLSIDFQALGYFFSELSTPHEGTIWKEIKKLKPGSYLRFHESGISEYKSYWNLKYTEDCALSTEDIISKTSLLLSQAVKKRLVADVQVSALLSGGIDSSLIVAKMAEHSSGRVKTYSAGFKEVQFNELPYARQVANKFNTDHTELVIDTISLDKINELILEYGEPFADSSMIPSYLMSKEISRNEKVVLGGDGGDEFFGGYDSYYFAHKFDSVKRFGFMYSLVDKLSSVYPSYRTNFFKRLLYRTKFPRYTLLNRNFSFSEEQLKLLLNNSDFITGQQKEHLHIWNNYTPKSSSDLINVMSASLKTRLVNDYLVKVDRASMYASLEMRSPFLDKDLAEFAATLKPRQLFYRTGTKSILKAMAEEHFTKEFTHRKKMGFGIPIGDWFRGDLIHDLKEVVLGGKQTKIDFDYQFIEKVLNEHTSGVADHTHELWSLYVFHIWANNQ